MDNIEERVRRLEIESASKNNQLWELTARVERIEKIIRDLVPAQQGQGVAMGDCHQSGLDCRQAYEELTSISAKFNQLLPHVAVLLGVKDADGKGRRPSVQSNASAASNTAGYFGALQKAPTGAAGRAVNAKVKESQKNKVVPLETAVPTKRESKNKIAGCEASGKKSVVSNLQINKAGNNNGLSRRKLKGMSRKKVNGATSEGSSYDTVSEADSQNPEDILQGSGFKRCRKLCNNTPDRRGGHPCNVVHDPVDPCPPCQKLMTDLKLKCGHRTSVLCHRQYKISEFCSECESKRLLYNAPPTSSLPVLQFPFDSLQSPAEVDFKKVRDILKKISSSNFEKLSEELVAIVNSESKYLPEYANVFVERAVMDANNQSSVVTYAKLISCAINPPSGRLKMLAIEVTNTLFQVVASLFKLQCNDTPSAFVTALLKKRDVTEMEQKSRNNGVLRFVGELYNYDVIELGDLKDRLIEPLLDKATDESLGYLCKILTLVGSKINGEISKSGKAADSVWFGGLFAKLESIISADPAQNNSIKLPLENLIKLRNAGWDRFRKENGTEYQLTPEQVTVPKEDKVKAENKVQPPQKKDSATLIKPDAKKKPVVNSCFSQIKEPVNFLDGWETAPWGEHVDPLSALPPILAGQTSVEPSDSSFMVPLTTNFVSMSIGKSATSSRNISPAVSVSSLPRTSSNEINAKALFSQYEKKDSKPQRERIDWLRQKLKGKSGSQRQTLIRNLSVLIPGMNARKELAAMGHLFDILMKAEIINEEMIMAGVVSGVISDLPGYWRTAPPGKFDDVVENVAIVLVTAWEQRMKCLSWLTALGETLHVSDPEVWYYFSLGVMEKVHERKKPKETRHLYNQSKSKGILEEQAKTLKVA